MATLRVPDFAQSASRQMAVEDARRTQAAVLEECARSEQDPPPYILTELVGKGSFGRVYRATRTTSVDDEGGTEDESHTLPPRSNQLVAVKIINIEESDHHHATPRLANTFADLLREVNTVKMLSQGGTRNINRVLDTLLVGPAVWIVTEFCAGGSVATLMRPTGGGLPERWIVPILRETAEAVSWVHRRGVIHRDIKCANVLVTDAGAVQLCDFGVAAVLEEGSGGAAAAAAAVDKKRSTVTGTLHWMAPELFDPDPAYGTEVDVWAFGSMVYEVASGLPPNVSAAAVDIATFGSRLRQQCPRLEGERYSSQLRDLVAFCLVEDPKKRPSIADIQQHPYLFGTADRFPTESLAQLVKAYRLWEAQGGVRKSLFVPGGAAHPDEEAEPRASTGSRDGDEWSFDTASFEDDFADADIQAVYDAYGYTVEFAPETLRAAPHRRGPPPSRTGPPLRGPLEKVFDPNTLSGYDENSRAFYGLATPEAVRTTSTSDLPLRSSTQDADLRESLIDLDMSLDGSRLSRFADTGTQYVAAGGSETMLSLDPRPLPKENAPSPPPKPDSNRRTQDWTFPVMSPSPPKPSSLQKTGLQAVGTASYSRLSAVSLIDLDAGNPGPRPSTAHSNSSSSVDSGSFDLDGNSIFGRRLPVSCSTRLPPPGATIPRKPLAQRRPVKEEEEDEEQQQQPRATNRPFPLKLLPLAPLPPTAAVMEGRSSREEVRDELLRLVASMAEHLRFADGAIRRQPVRRAAPVARDRLSSSSS